MVNYSSVNLNKNYSFKKKNVTSHGVDTLQSDPMNSTTYMELMHFYIGLTLIFIENWVLKEWIMDLEPAFSCSILLSGQNTNK